MRFTRAYTPLCTCSPARASLMTGLLPHNHGVLEVEHCVDSDQCALRADKPHFAQRLAAAGYVTGYFGKWHIERTERLENFGWQANFSWRSQAYQDAQAQLPEIGDGRLDPQNTFWLRNAPGYMRQLYYGVTDEPVARRHVSIPVSFALPWLDRVLAGERPWCCCVSFSEPNEALVCSRETFARYDLDAIVLPASLRDPLSGRPNLYRRAAGVWRNMTDDAWRRARACWYARMTEVDAQLGRLIEKIEAAGALDNTLIIVTSDHGRHLGAHGLDGHNFGAFEEIYNIPLLISGPGVRSDSVTDARVGLHDLCPTLLELADAERIVAPDSRSFAEALSNESAASRFSTGYAEYHGTRYRLTQRIYWEGDWKFVFNGFDFDELYNLAEDPHEMRNLARDGAQKERVRMMMSAIWRRVRETRDKPLLESHYYTMQMAPLGPDADGAMP